MSLLKILTEEEQAGATPGPWDCAAPVDPFAAEPVPLVSLELGPDDPSYACLEIHTLPLDARLLQFLRIDGYWFVKASEGVNEALDEAWRAAWRETGGGNA